MYEVLDDIQVASLDSSFSASSDASSGTSSGSTTSSGDGDGAGAGAGEDIPKLTTSKQQCCACAPTVKNSANTTSMSTFSTDGSLVTSVEQPSPEFLNLLELEPSSVTASKTASKIEDTLTIATEPTSTSESDSSSVSSSESAVSTSSSCCPCVGGKKFGIVLNLATPPDVLKVTTFKSELKSEIQQGMRQLDGRVQVGLVMPTPDGKTSVEFTVSGTGDAKLVEDVVSSISNPAAPVNQGPIMSTLLKSRGLTVSTEPSPSACDASTKKWNYKEDDPLSNITNTTNAGPNHWKNLFPKCGLEGVQSPIRLPLSMSAVVEPVFRRLDFDYTANKPSLINDGRNLIFMFQPGSSFRVSGETSSHAQLVYATFHSPSEHVFTDDSGNDIRYAAEIQMHHKTPDGRSVVVAVLFKVNAANPFFDKLFHIVPKYCKSQALDNDIKFEEIFPFSRSYYMYYGTLTSPPCTEDTTWYVLREQGTMSMEQLERIRAALQLDYKAPPVINEAEYTKLETEGGHTIQVQDLDTYPPYAYSKTLMGDARPLQPLGKRKLWGTPSKQ